MCIVDILPLLAGLVVTFPKKKCICLWKNSLHYLDYCQNYEPKSELRLRLNWIATFVSYTKFIYYSVLYYTLKFMLLIMNHCKDSRFKIYPNVKLGKIIIGNSNIFLIFHMSLLFEWVCCDLEVAWSHDNWLTMLINDHAWRINKMYWCKKSVSLQLKNSTVLCVSDSMFGLKISLYNIIIASSRTITFPVM